MRRLLCSLLLAALAGAVIAAQAAAFPANGNVLFTCFYDHTATDDPIVFPSQPGASHSHDFAGAAGTDAFTTFSSLASSATNCQIPADRSGYWVPTLIAADGVTQVHFNSMAIYWRGNGRDTLTSPLVPFQNGVQEVDGNSKNTSPNTYAETYRCHDASGTSVYIPASCNPGVGVEASLYFPTCTAATTTVSDHHVLGTCGPSFTIPVASVQVIVEYPAAAAGGALSSDYMVLNGLSHPGLTGHADWFAAFDLEVQQRVLTNCVETAAVQCRIDASGNLIDVGQAAHPIVIPAALLAYGS